MKYAECLHYFLKGSIYKPISKLETIPSKVIFNHYVYVWGGIDES